MIILLRKLDLNLLYDTQRMLAKIMNDVYINSRNNVSSSSNNTNNNNDKHIKKLNNHKVFFLELVDQELKSFDHSRIETEERIILLDNLHIINGEYEIMTKSFQATANKSINKLNLVKLTPIFNHNKKSEDTYKIVPFIDFETKELICTFCIKFFNENQRSLSNTMESSSSYKSHQKLSNDHDTENSQFMYSIFYNPIYFCVFNQTGHLIKEINSILNLSD